MDQLIPVLMIVGMVAFIMMRQINKVTQRVDNNPLSRASTGDYERYAKFSAIIQEYVREIKSSLDSTKEQTERSFKLQEGKNETQALEKLSDFIRKLVFFETMMAKQKSTKEIEADLFEVLNGLENFLIEFCEDGENLAEALREKLLEGYESL
jgi:hypothetical protein